MATTYNYGSPSGNVLVPVANLQKRTKQLDISAAVTCNDGTSISTKQVEAIFFADSAGKWWMQVSSKIDFSAETDLTGNTLSFAIGANFASSPANQVLTFAAYSGAVALQAAALVTDGAAATMSFSGSVSTIRYVRFSGCVALADEPTSYTTAANMEGAPNVAAYVPSASASVAGLVDTTTQIFAGAKTFNSGMVINESGADSDTRIEGDTDVNLLFCDASADKIGIGTSSPKVKCEVYGGVLSAINGGAESSPTEVLRLGRATYPDSYYHSIAVSSGNGASTGHFMNFLLNNATTTGQTTVMALRGDGNVGIGTVSPGCKLHVNGQIFSGATYSANGPNQGKVYGVSLEDGIIDSYRNAGNAGYFGRNNDGSILGFWVNGTQEGSISVSSGTTSYNSFCGSHWSQLIDNSRVEILKGTVMESLPELCIWAGESNDHLPKCKISDTAGSKAVYGVFMSWDDDDKVNNDMYVAALGAFVIRVQVGQVVQIGDYLESAGDGTAKVQSDDVLRSKTIAKVTSTQIVTTYPDGSYLVPCTLHCG